MPMSQTLGVNSLNFMIARLKEDACNFLRFIGLFLENTMGTSDEHFRVNISYHCFTFYSLNVHKTI